MSLQLTQLDTRFMFADGAAADLRRYTASVYWRMAAGVAISAAGAWLVAQNHALASVLFAPDGLTAAGRVVTLAPLALVFVISAGIDRLGSTAASAIFVFYAALVGVSLGGLVLAYSGHSLMTTFLGCAAGFAALAWTGATVRTDLSALRTFFLVGVCGLLALMLLNLLMRSAAVDFALSAIGVLLFAGLTAFEAQRVKQGYLDADDDGRPRLAVVGALCLYLDFLNLFLFMLRFTGRRRR